MTTETTIPEAPPTTEEYYPLPTPEEACRPNWRLESINGEFVCVPVQTAPPEPTPQPEGVNVPTVTVGVNMPTECADPLQQGFCAAPLAAPAAVTAEVAVAPAQSLPMTGSGETIGIALVAAVVLSAGIAMLRAAKVTG